MRQRRSDRADIAHDVELPVRVPLLVGDVLEARLARDPDVVDQDVETAERSDRLGHGALWLARHGQVALDVECLSDAGRGAATTGCDAGGLCRKLRGDFTPDPARRARDETDPIGEPELHGG